MLKVLHTFPQAPIVGDVMIAEIEANQAGNGPVFLQGTADCRVQICQNVKDTQTRYSYNGKHGKLLSTLFGVGLFKYEYTDIQELVDVRQLVQI